MNREDIYYKLTYNDSEEVYVTEEHLMGILKTQNIPSSITRVSKLVGLSDIREDKIKKLLGEE